MKIRTKFNKENTFFTSDTHYFHENIINFCNRPFIDLNDMHYNLIKNWNDVVPKDGVVFHSGDFAMTSNINLIEKIVNQLNGQIYLVMGNHDYQNRFNRDVIQKLFYMVDDIFYISVEDDDYPAKHVNFQISHYPFLYWYRSYINLHGHVHSGPNSTASEKVPLHEKRYDVGVDNNEYKPISYSNLMIKINNHGMGN